MNFVTWNETKKDLSPWNMVLLTFTETTSPASGTSRRKGSIRDGRRGSRLLDKDSATGCLLLLIFIKYTRKSSVDHFDFNLNQPSYFIKHILTWPIWIYWLLDIQRWFFQIHIYFLSHYCIQRDTAAVSTRGKGAPDPSQKTIRSSVWMWITYRRRRLILISRFFFTSILQYAWTLACFLSAESCWNVVLS